MTRLVLVTGASGGVGARTVVALGDRGWAVRALVHRSPVREADEFVDGDVLDPVTAAKAIAGVDAVVHLAGVTHARDSRAYDANVQGIRNILDAAKAAAVARVVYVSTRAIDSRGGAYSASKLAAERVCATSEVPTTIVRLPEVYGAGSREGIDALIERASRVRRVAVVGDGRQVVCPVHVDDVARALAVAASSPDGIDTTYTLAGECLTITELVERYARNANRTARIVHVPVPVVAGLARAARVLPLPLYPDQLARLLVPKEGASPNAATDLGFSPRRLFPESPPGA